MVGGAASGRLPLVRLDEFALGVDAHELAVAADRNLLAEVASRHGVERLLELDVVVGVDGALGPARRVVALAGQRQELVSLLVLEDDQGPLARGTMNPRAGGLEAPAYSFLLDMVAVAPGLASEEAVADVGDLALDERLPGRHPRRGRIDGEAPVGGVFLKRTMEERVVAIRLGDRALEVFDDQAAGDTPKEGPGILEPTDQKGDLLLMRDEDELVTAEDEHHHERPQHTTSTARGMGHQAEASKVQLGHLTRSGLGHSDRDTPALPEAAVGGGEAVQRAVGDVDALMPQELVDLGEAKATLLPGVRLQPLFDLLPVRKQQSLDFAGAPVAGGRLSCRHGGRQRLRRLVLARPPAQLHGRGHVAPDRLSAMACRTGHSRLGLAPTDPAEHVQHLPHRHLPIAHLARLLG